MIKASKTELSYIYLMMKRFAAMVLTFIYLSVSTGFTVNVHRCLGILTSVSLSDQASCVCAAAGPDLCCKTVLIKVELKDKSQKASIDLPGIATAILPSVCFPFSLARLQAGITEPDYIAEPSPGRFKLPDYILFRNFRI